MTNHDDEILSEEANETTALLPERPTLGQRISHISIHQTRSPRKILLLINLAVFVFSFGSILTGTPAIRIFEDIICHNYYESLGNDGRGGSIADIPEEYCKGKEVASELAVVLAGYEMSNVIPSILLSIPYGILADRIGRKYVFGLAIAGMLLQSLWTITVCWFWRVFPIRLIWLGSVCRLIGGGDPVATASLYALCSTLISHENRANAFLVINGSSFAAELLGPLVAAVLMEKSPWIPLLVGLATVAVGASLIAFVPESLNSSRSQTKPIDETGPHDDVSELSIASSNSSGSKSKSFIESLSQRIRTEWRNINDTTTFIYSVPMTLLLASYTSHQFGRIAMDSIPRYVSTRFSWKLSKAAVLQSLRSAVMIAVTMFLLPGINTILDRLHFATNDRDLLVIRVSGVFLVVGALVLAASSTVVVAIFGLVVYTFGGGFFSIARSLMTSLIDQTHVSQLYAVLAIVENVSILAGSPIWAALFAGGLHVGGFWVGLPYLVLSIGSLLSTVAVVIVRIPSEQ